jgi:hypothetical protein
MAALAIPHSLRRSAWASRARTAGVESFPLLAVLVYVADEHPAFEAGAGTLKASVVCLYRVVVILGRWVRVGCARLCGVHRAPPCGPGSGVCYHLRGHLSLSNAHILPLVLPNVNFCCIIFA